MGMRFTDRGQAGKLLAAALPQFRGRPDTVVLGLARGGVPVAAVAAAALGLPWDVLPVRKLGIPGHAETAFGALAAVNGRVVRVLNRPFVDQLLELGISQSALDEVVSVRAGGTGAPRRSVSRAAASADGQDRGRGRRRDGHGATMRAAVEAVRAAGAAAVVVGVPVASLEAQTSLQQPADAVFSLFIPGQFRAVGSYYRDFRQVRDDDVVRLLAARPA